MQFKPAVHVSVRFEYHPTYPNRLSESDTMAAVDTLSIVTDRARDADRLVELYQIKETDLEHIRRFGDVIVPRLDSYVSEFYSWLETQPEFDQFFSDPKKLARVQKQQVGYWKEFFRADIDDNYVAGRRDVGDAHARIGLPLHTYLAAMNLSLKIFTETLYDGSFSESDYVTKLRALSKLVHFDTGIVAEAFMTRVNNIIAEQNEALIEMSTPVTTIWTGVLLLPIVGVIDSRRAQDVMNAILTQIADKRAKVTILDISGVPVVDTAVANHLIKITKATKLMGCETTISGISPSIAQTMVELGIDVGGVSTTATLRDAVDYAWQVTGT